ncbi:MAG: hypothetical protein M3160_09450 [Candidatus Eremiobacteraeota bacterium]|nr:hypothetical protein [Candidatus Eremiobacteraeota bacterium]
MRTCRLIRAYPAKPTIASGTSLTLHVATDAARFRVEFYRCGATFEPMHHAATGWFDGQDAKPGKPGRRWQWPSFTFSVPPCWSSGAYVALCIEGTADGADQSRPHCHCPDGRDARALFVVRNLLSTARILYNIPLFTYHAYNVAHVDGTKRIDEGECLYSGANAVSLQRPGGGTGGHPWDEVNVDVYDRATPRQTFAHWDAKAIAWLERSGFAIDYCTDLDLHASHDVLRQYGLLVTFGHNEYWSSEMRARVECFVQAGGNVAFFGGNTCWFRVLVDEADSAISRAGRWDERCEHYLTGVSFRNGGGKWIADRPPTGYCVTNPQHWIYTGCAVQRGGIFGAHQRLIGYECDGVCDDSNLQILGSASLKEWNVRDGSGEVSANARATMVIFARNGTVFNAGTTDWARVLHEGDPIVQRITSNVITRLSSAHGSTDSP